MEYEPLRAATRSVTNVTFVTCVCTSVCRGRSRYRALHILRAVQALAVENIVVCYAYQDTLCQSCTSAGPSERFPNLRLRCLSSFAHLDKHNHCLTDSRLTSPGARLSAVACLAAPLHDSPHCGSRAEEYQNGRRVPARPQNAANVLWRHVRSTCCRSLLRHRCTTAARAMG